MKSSVEVRRCRLEDAMAVGELWIALLEDGGSHSQYYIPADDALDRWKSDFPGWISSKDRYLGVAKVDTKIVAFIHACAWDLPPVFERVNEIFVNEIYVAPEHRKKGIARTLLESVSEWATTQGASNIRATAISNKSDSIAFWKSMGARELTTDFVIQLDPHGSKPKKRRVKLGF